MQGENMVQIFWYRSFIQLCPISVFFRSRNEASSQFDIADFFDFASTSEDQDISMVCKQKYMVNKHVDIPVVASTPNTIKSSITRWMRTMYQTLKYIILGTLVVVFFILPIARYIPLIKLSKILFKYHANKIVQYQRWDGDSPAGGHLGYSKYRIPPPRFNEGGTIISLS